MTPPEETTTAPPPLQPTAAGLASEERRAITWRSVALGLLGTVLICGVTPYNDYALNNTFMVGNNLPLGLILLTFLLAVLVNGPLSRWWPERALSSGEMAVAFCMVLVSCCLPSSGLMRYFPATLVSPFWLAQGNADYAALLDKLKLPAWMLPTMHGSRVRDWIADPIVRGYVGRWTEPGSPYGAWVRPAIAWGIFLMSLYGALLCLMAIVRRQWMENERLPFPLAQIELALVEQPERGKWFNALLGKRSFWIAFAAIFLLHVWNGLSHSFPQYFPEIPVWYSQEQLFTRPPWIYLDFKVKDAAVFFTVVGVTYFLPGSIAFSLWFFFVLNNVGRVFRGTFTDSPENFGVLDEHFGGVVAYALLVAWIGRGQWKLVVRQAFRGVRDDEPRGRYLGYPVAVWGLVGCCSVMIGWLWLAGSTLLGAMVAIGMLLMLFMVITRIIAETGLVHGMLMVGMVKPWDLLATYGWAHPVPLKAYYLTQLVDSSHFDFREPMPVYTSHGMKVADQAIFGGRSLARDDRAERRTGRRFAGLLLLSLLVGYGVSLSSMLWTEYHYAATQDSDQLVPLNQWGTLDVPRWHLMDSTIQYEQNNYHPRHSPIGHAAFGFLFTLALGLLRLRYTSWPLHPVGFLMVGTFPGGHLWLSIFLGWLAKSLIVRFGGPRMYVGAKPFFLGLIVGESVAAGMWMVVGMLQGAMGVPYRPVHIMPG